MILGSGAFGKKPRPFELLLEGPVKCSLVYFPCLIDSFVAEKEWPHFWEPCYSEPLISFSLILGEVENSGF